MFSDEAWAKVAARAPVITLEFQAGKRRQSEEGPKGLTFQGVSKLFIQDLFFEAHLVTSACITLAASSCKQGWDWSLLARHNATLNKTRVLLVKKGRILSRQLVVFALYTWQVVYCMNKLSLVCLYY